MKIDRNVIFAAVICLAAGWWLASSPDSPIRPTPPRPDRPVLAFLSKFAHTFLWVMMFAERAPETPNQFSAQIDHEGRPLINHSRGW